MNSCDICGSTKKVVAGRWIFYCPKHKNKDWELSYENEVAPDLESGNMDYINSDGELQEKIIENM